MKLILPTKLFGRIKKPLIHPHHARFKTVMRANLPLPPLIYDVDSCFSFAIPPRMWHNDVEGDCHDEKTEVLTEHGWRFWPDYDGKSLLGTMNPRTEMLEYQAPSSVTRREHDGMMAFSNHRRMDFVATPNHRLIYRPYEIPDPYFPGGGAYGSSRFGTIASRPTRIMIPGATKGFLGTGLKSIIIGNRSWDGTDFLRLLAVFVSDGWVREHETHRNSISFCCFREDRRTMVANLAYRLGISETSYRPGLWIFQDPALAEWLRVNAYTGGEYRSPFKKVPDLVKVADQFQIEEFLSFFGDQHIKESRSFYSSSERLMDDLQELLLKTGKRGTLRSLGIRDSHETSDGRVYRQTCPAFALNENKEGNDVSVLRRDIEYHWHRGEVFCATVPNSTLVTRRNGRILISGNCVIAARANQQTRFFAGLYGELRVISDDDVQSEYISETGGPDTGLVPDDSLSLWQSKGWNSAGADYRIAAWARVNAADRLEVQRCTFMLCGMQLSLPLPTIWNDALNQGLPWDVPSANQVGTQDAELDSWGGHQVFVKGYNEKGVICLTWGQEQLITWEALAWAGLESNGGEAEGIVRFNDPSTTPTDHIDVTTLLSELAVIQEAS